MGRGLAIKGNKERASDVIKLLEDFGGINVSLLDGSLEYYIYTVKDDIEEIQAFPSMDKHYCIMTIEEFEKRFPFRIDDDVICSDGVPGTIVDLFWDSKKEEVEYGVDFGHGIDYGCYYSKSLQPYEPKKNENDVKKPTSELNVPQISLTKEKEGKYKVILPKHTKLEVINGEYYLIEDLSSKFPKTFNECAETLCFPSVDVMVGYQNILLEKYQQLIICRDAYWAILDWKPDYNDNKLKYVIEYSYNEVGFERYQKTSRLLAFPTEEIRDIFYKNFKTLINDCKELI